MIIYDLYMIILGQSMKTHDPYELTVGAEVWGRKPKPQFRFNGKTIVIPVTILIIVVIDFYCFVSFCVCLISILTYSRLIKFDTRKSKFARRRLS